MDIVVGGNTLGAGAQGMLGQNILNGDDVDYDLASGAIRLMRPQGCEKTELAYWDRNKPYSWLKMQSGPPLSGARGIAYLNGKKIHVLFDTGSALSVLSLHAAERAGFRSTNPGVLFGGTSYGMGGRSVPTWIAPFDSFKLGSEEIRNTRLRVADVGFGDVEMLIGADFFLAHHVYVANSQHKIYFTYNGGPVFNLSVYQPPRSAAASSQSPLRPGATAPRVAAAAQPAGESGQTPGDAAGFARRGAALDARGEFSLAIADLTRALALDPSNAGYFQQRGSYEVNARQLPPAMADLNRALQLQADDVPARLLRAQLRVRAGDRFGADEDAAAVDRAVPKQADVRLGLARIYLATDQWDAAVSQLSLWLASHPRDIGLAAALNERCRARALQATQLRAALNDCNAAVRLSQTKLARAASLDSRALVRLRMQDLTGSVRDYDAALALAPQRPSSLYGRGIAEIRQRRLELGQADLRAATALRADVANPFRRAGIGP